MTTTSYSIAPGESTEDLAIKRRLALQLLQQGMDISPIQHPMQGFARMAQAGLGGYELYQAKQEDEKEKEAARKAMLELLGPQSTAPAAPSAPAAPTTPPMGSVAAPARAGREYINGTPIYSQDEVNPMDVAGAGYGNAIARTESGGRYNAVGPTVASGDRAYGKHQVMGVNVGPWTQAVSGTAATPQQFIANPQLQEDTFNNKFADYINRFGSPEAASRAWFAGERGMNNPNARDVNGTTVAGYSRQFTQNAAVPGQASQPPQMGSAVASAPPAQSPQMGSVAAQPQVTPQQRAMITTLLGNRFTAPMGQQIISNIAMQQFKEPKVQVVGDQLVSIAPNGTVTPLYDATKKTDNERNLAAENAARAQRGERPLSMTEYEQAKEAAQTRGKDQGTTQASLETTVARARDALDTINQIRQHPGKQYGVGVLGVLPGIPGTAQRGFISLVDQAKGQTFLEAYNSLRGGGQITEVEGRQARDAIARLDRAQSPNDFDKALSDLEAIIRAGIGRAQNRAAGGASLTPQPQPQQPGGTTVQASRTIGGKSYVKINDQWFEQ